ncbi:hypothetical protein FZEAL_9800 [Fusarium zealandicum]|uniref:Uncharacterized protein n=1 Tax=Fusarium zealandicum TaxID=1053134 RepID=A0A8H4U892_9HYPO|nr:hypothetical protein FZEAL_9800 [Fusarium zealandicum]
MHNENAAQYRTVSPGSEPGSKHVSESESIKFPQGHDASAVCGLRSAVCGLRGWCPTRHRDSSMSLEQQQTSQSLVNSRWLRLRTSVDLPLLWHTGSPVPVPTLCFMAGPDREPGGGDARMSTLNGTQITPAVDAHACGPGGLLLLLNPVLLLLWPTSLEGSGSGSRPGS